MSSNSFVTEPDDDVCSPSGHVRVALVERYCNDFRNAIAQRRISQEENFLSVSCLRRLPSFRTDRPTIGSYVRLQWYWNKDTDFLEDEFKIVQPSEFDIVLGARACQRMKEIDEEDEVVLFAAMFMAKEEKKAKSKSKSKSKEQKKKDAAAEALRRAELRERNRQLAQQQIVKILEDIKPEDKDGIHGNDSNQDKGKGKA